ncbi:MAG: STAS domain-containing protein [Acidobacteriota bacterium]
MNIEVKKKNKINILQLSGRFVLGEPTTLYATKFKELLDAGERLFVLDMREVPFTDTSGQGEMVASAIRARKQKGDIKLVLVPKGKVYELLTIVFLHKYFEIFEEMEDALASFVK